MGAGNFAASLLCRPDCAMADMAKFSFVAALALHDTLVGVGVDPAELHLKWPNDVLLSGRKLSGILLETVETAAGPGLIVGIGVNLAVAPDAADLEARAHAPITLAEHGITIGPEQFLDQLAPAFAARQGMFLADGFSPIRAAWLSRAKGVGQEITARLPHATHVGIFEDVDDDGALILATGKGRLVLPAADVYF